MVCGNGGHDVAFSAGAVGVKARALDRAGDWLGGSGPVESCHGEGSNGRSWLRLTVGRTGVVGLPNSDK